MIDRQRQNKVRKDLSGRSRYSLILRKRVEDPNAVAETFPRPLAGACDEKALTTLSQFILVVDASKTTPFAFDGEFLTD